MSTAPEGDASLVARSMAGHRPAFAQIVTRYQALVCSVAYSATGNLGRSEDVAQETFLTAWRRLRELREPERLRAWLCGIARNLSQNLVRGETHEPANAALPIEAAADSPCGDPALIEAAIRDEEQAILWRSIGRMPAAYREPLVLFYREQQSVERVAASLELSEDTVRQRLSRGRKLLHEEVLAFVEGALERSAPGKAFTLAVLAALPAAGMAPAAGAAVAGVGAAQGSALAKSGVFAALLGLAGPIIGAVSIWLGVRAGLDAAPTARERAAVWRQSAVLVGASIAYSVLLVALVSLGPTLGDEAGPALALGAALAGAFAAFVVALMPRYLRELRVLRAQAGGASMCREFRSDFTLLGLPIYHVRYGTPAVDSKPVRAWFAAGDRAIGGLFAMGHVAIAPVSVGVVSAGVLCVGGVSAGVLPMAAVALGVLPLGGAAFGLLPIGGFAAGMPAAIGGLAIATDYAAGGWAVAAHANDAIARTFVAAWLPEWLLPAMIGTIALLAIVPSLVFASRQRRHLKTPRE